jgi:hypothetical protein
MSAHAASGGGGGGGGGSGGGGGGGGSGGASPVVEVDVNAERAAKKMARAKRKGRPGETLLCQSRRWRFSWRNSPTRRLHGAGRHVIHGTCIEACSHEHALFGQCPFSPGLGHPRSHACVPAPRCDTCAASEK